ncbi:MAG: NmrA family NAD(P)-binding protein [Alphaproteobacteria bacterium]|nr:NmrA family NAD(P)-binding protein [Alphaproteobacteria bacterium]
MHRELIPKLGMEQDMNEHLIAITGATGVTGQHLTTRLKAHSLKTRYLVRDAERARGILGENVDLVTADLDDRISLDRALEGVHTLYLNSGHSPVLEEQQTNAIEAAVNAGCARIVKLSGNIDSPAPIPEAHKALEQKIVNCGTRYTFLRPNFYMTNLLYVAAGLKEGDRFTSAIPRDVTISMTDPRDVADLTATILAEDDKHDGQGYYQTGAALSLDQAAETFSKVLNRDIRYDTVDVDIWEDMVTKRGLPSWLIEHQVKMIGFAANGAYSYVTNATQDITGNTPRTLETFITDHAATFTPA